MDLSGKTLNRYEIRSPIGKGGMGEVYAAEDLRLGRRVAIKVLPADLAGDPDRRMRFEREARAVAALNHPNIVTIYSVEAAQGIDFITMEMVAGKALSELIPKGGLPLDRLLALAVPLADAVGTAHRTGIVHRDLKPDNVVVDEHGRPKILDFGLAKLRPEAENSPRATQLPTRTEQTQEGRILGTVSYMSPEQAEGRAVDERSDIFSLGVLLYEAATGRRPFRGDTAISTISSILRDTPESILDLKHTLPRHLGRIVARCLQKDPERRYQSALDLRNDLEGLQEEIRSGEPAVEAPAAAGRGRRFRGLLTAAPVVAALALGFWGSRLLDRGGGQAPSAFEGMKLTRLTTSGDSGEAAISPDGKHVVYVKEGEEGDSLWLRQVRRPSGVQIVPPAGAVIYDPRFSPDGDAIYFVKRERVAGASVPVLFRVPALGGTPMKVLGDVSERVSFSPDGSRFAFKRTTTASSLVMTADRDGGDLRTIGERTFPDEFAEEPAWSPDGSIVAVAAVRWTGRMEHHLVALPVVGGAEQPISQRTWAEIAEIAWLPDGSGLVIEARETMVGAGQLWEVSYPDGRARRITNDLNSYHGVGITADGSTLVTVASERRANLWIVEGGDAGGARELAWPTGWSADLLAWTPDGRIVHSSALDGNTDVWIADPEGDATQLTVHPAQDYDPVVCADRYVVYVSSREGSHNLWRMDLDGSGKIRLTSGEGEYLPRCDPDHGRVVFMQQGPMHVVISAVPIDGGQAIPLGEESNLGWWTLDLSSDGDRLAYTSFDEATGRWVLEILDLSDGRTTRPVDLAMGVDAPLRWSPDRDAFHYVVLDRGVDNIWSTPFDGGPPERLTRFEEGRITAFAWSSDGTRMALARGTVSSDIVLLERFR